MRPAWLDARPLVLAVAGPNGAGKSTFYHAHLAAAGLPWVNADVLPAEFSLAPYEAARVADRVRRELVSQRESFLFETVFSDPVGDKLAFLSDAAVRGYTAGLIFIGLDSARTSSERVAMRVSQGEHDVPVEKLRERFPRTMANLARAIETLPHVLVYDNSDLGRPYRLVAEYRDGAQTADATEIPEWFRSIHK